MDEKVSSIFPAETAALPFTRADIDSTVELVKSRAIELCANKAELLRLITFIDLTTLSGDDTRERVERLVDRALLPYTAEPELHCAAVCVYPSRVPDAIERLRALGKELSVASVAGGFPSGQYPLCSRLIEVEWAVKAGAQEIDVVIDRASALEGKWGVVYDELRQIRGLCGTNAHMKVILSVGELGTDENVYKASWTAMLAGADFIKTSTGKEKTNATLHSAYIMSMAIRRYCELCGDKRVGFKPAGGIQTAQDAMGYRAIVEEVLGREWLTPSLFRLGASSLLDSIIKELSSQ